MSFSEKYSKKIDLANSAIITLAISFLLLTVDIQPNLWIAMENKGFTEDALAELIYKAVSTIIMAGLYRRFMTEDEPYKNIWLLVEKIIGPIAMSVALTIYLGQQVLYGFNTNFYFSFVLYFIVEIIASSLNRQFKTYEKYESNRYYGFFCTMKKSRIGLAHNLFFSFYILSLVVLWLPIKFSIVQVYVSLLIYFGVCCALFLMNRNFFKKNPEKFYKAIDILPRFENAKQLVQYFKLNIMWALPEDVCKSYTDVLIDINDLTLDTVYMINIPDRVCAFYKALQSCKNTHCYCGAIDKLTLEELRGKIIGVKHHFNSKPIIMKILFGASLVIIMDNVQ